MTKDTYSDEIYFHFISIHGRGDVKFQSFSERTEFHGVSPQIRVFQGFHRFSNELFQVI